MLLLLFWWDDEDISSIFGEIIWWMLLIVFPLVTPTVGSMSPWKIQENERHGVRENVTKSGKTEPKRASGLASVEFRFACCSYFILEYRRNRKARALRWSRLRLASVLVGLPSRLKAFALRWVSVLFIWVSSVCSWVANNHFQLMLVINDPFVTQSVDRQE